MTMKYKTIAEAKYHLSAEDFDKWMDEGFERAKQEREDKEENQHENQGKDNRSIKEPRKSGKVRNEWQM